jgi:hypothetical protein
MQDRLFPRFFQELTSSSPEPDTLQPPAYLHGYTTSSSTSHHSAYISRPPPYSLLPSIHREHEPPSFPISQNMLDLRRAARASHQYRIRERVFQSRCIPEATGYETVFDELPRYEEVATPMTEEPRAVSPPPYQLIPPNLEGERPGLGNLWPLLDPEFHDWMTRLWAQRQHEMEAPCRFCGLRHPGWHAEHSTFRRLRNIPPSSLFGNEDANERRRTSGPVIPEPRPYTLAPTTLPSRSRSPSRTIRPGHVPVLRSRSRATEPRGTPASHIHGPASQMPLRGIRSAPTQFRVNVRRHEDDNASLNAELSANIVREKSRNTKQYNPDSRRYGFGRFES